MSAWQIARILMRVPGLRSLAQWAKIRFGLVQYVRWNDLNSRNQLVELDFPVHPKARHGYGHPSDVRIGARLAARKDHYATLMKSMLPLVQPMLTIPAHEVANKAEPNWINLAFPALDAIALYGLIAVRRPRRFVEIGSGFSTKFARRAIVDHSLDTRIISIDPQPRAEIDELCDEVVRLPLEKADLSIFDSLSADDLVFFDGSHRSFQNSDVTVFFTEVLPRLPSGLMFGIHDVYLPDDYPPGWTDRFFNEQYLLSCWLLAGDRLQVDFPAHFVGSDGDLYSIFSPMWEHPALAGAYHRGGCFFATLR